MTHDQQKCTKKKILLIMKLNFFCQMLGKISEMKHFTFLLALCVSLTRQKMKYLSLSGKSLPVRNMSVLKTQFQYDLKKKKKNKMINIAE